MILFLLEDLQDVILCSKANRICDRNNLRGLQMTESMNGNEQRGGRTTYCLGTTRVDFDAWEDICIGAASELWG